MRVIGTAGHVDHGKSTLVEALTGTHPDRLKEEREREMTIDLGFAWLTLPDGSEVGIVDVPGHRDFIENMLAGVGGVDAALFVVAADEGVMPQTREHLAILDLLQVQGGAIALTKLDLVPDEDWLALVEDDLRQTLAGTALGAAPIVRVSARTGEGVDAIKSALAACLADRPPRPDLGRPRLPIDRVFTMAGFGTVVTGTLVDGSLRVGDEVVVLPPGHKARVRGLQTHKRKEDAAVPGGRTAVNLSGVDMDDIARGFVVAHPGTYTATRRLDVRFRCLPDAAQPLKHNTEVKVFIGAAESIARLRLLGVEELLPGGEAWLQLELRQPVVAARGDRYILRRPSPGETLGGGQVVDPQPERRHKRFNPALLDRLEALTQGAPEDILLQALVQLGVTPAKEAVAQSHLDADAAAQALRDLHKSGQLVVLSKGELKPDGQVLVAAKTVWGNLTAQALGAVTQYHADHALRAGMPREELKSRLRLEPKVFNALLVNLTASGSLIGSGPAVAVPGHEIRFAPHQQAAVDALLAQFTRQPYAPPTVKDCQAQVGEDVTAALIELGQLVSVSNEVVFRKGDYEGMLAAVKEMLAGDGTITVAQVRDRFDTSRRYVLALLEHLDAIGLTRRDGDVRRLK